MTDTIVDEGQDVTEDTATDTATDEVKAERAKTTYLDPTAEALDDLPENPKVTRAGGGRAKVYHTLLEQVAEQGVDNKWRSLARFGTKTGAKTVALALNRQVQGKIGEGEGLVKPEQVKDIPEYQGVKWLFDSRRVPSEANPEVIESVLYCKLVSDEDYARLTAEQDDSNDE